MKEVQEGARAQAWGCPRHPKTYSKEPQASNLGDAQGIPLLRQQSPGFPRITIFLFLCPLCVILGASFCFCFQFSFAFFAGHIDTFGPLFCFGERHAPLFHETLIFFTYIFLSVIASYVLLLALVFIYHHVQSY